MPFYFDVSRVLTTNSTTQTLSTHLRALTVANQRVCRVIQVLAKARHSAAGGAVARLITAGTAGSGGTSTTPGKRTAANPAASTTWLHDGTAITPGATPAVRQTLGFAQTGGTGGWTAVEPDAAIQLEPNGGANGNFEVASQAIGTSVPGECTVEFSE